MFFISYCSKLLIQKMQVLLEIPGRIIDSSFGMYHIYREWHGWLTGILVPTSTYDMHKFTPQSKSKNIQNDLKLKEIEPTSMNLTKLAVSHSVLGQKICCWAHFEHSGMCLR